MKKLSWLVALCLSAAAVPASAASGPDLSGTWRINLRTDYSSCKATPRGDVVQVEWVFTLGKPGEVTLVTNGSDNLDDRFAGRVQGDKLSLQTRRLDHLSTLELTVTGANLTGRRVDANSLPCAVIYEVTGRKQ